MRARRWLVVLLLFLALSSVGVAGLAWLVVVYPDTHGRGAGKTAAIEIAEHATLSDAAFALQRARLIGEASVFALYARVLGASTRLRHGRILVTDSMSPHELLQRIAKGYGSAVLRITIPEGWNRLDIAERLAEWGVCEPAAFLAATEERALLDVLDLQGSSAEGFLFPDTYRLLDTMTPAQLVERLVSNGQRRMQRLLESEGAALTRLQSEFDFGVREVVTLASIVEKEAHLASEQPVIAGVFLNRLSDPSFRPKRLQADPTVAYGCLVATTLPSCLGFDGKRVTRTMTSDPSNTYNTYRIEGLPPGPIANPGISALRAVLDPARHGYFYFVARGDGHHEFTETLPAHNLAVQRFSNR